MPGVAHPGFEIRPGRGLTVMGTYIAQQGGELPVGKRAIEARHPWSGLALRRPNAVEHDKDRIAWIGSRHRGADPEIDPVRWRHRRGAEMATAAGAGKYRRGG